MSIINYQVCHDGTHKIHQLGWRDFELQPAYSGTDVN